MASEYFDIVIVGAGISGIGSAYHLQDKCPNKSYVILEGRQAIGGTWDLFRYPGIRSDSDMYTFGYNFEPWKNPKSIADGASILEYLRDVVRTNRIDEKIRFGHRVTKAEWSSADSCWTLEARHEGSDEPVRIRCNVLLMCSGYYSYERGYTPEFAGLDSFRGTVVHPQHWPEDLDYRDKRVVVVGSGATAMTLIPAIAKEAAHVVMLQRSPTYVVALPSEDKIANFLRRWLPEKLAYRIIRWKNITLQQFYYKRIRQKPDEAKRRLIGMIRDQLGPDFDVETHFTPSYDPWDQRLCVVPDGDLFKAIRSGKASVATDHIDTFTETGILLKSGRSLDADLIVTATGLELVRLGNIEFLVDGEPVDFPNKFTYKGMMFSDVPNLVYTFGYINASWTLRADLTSEFVCRLLRHMDRKGYSTWTPRLRPEDRGMSPRPFIDGFTPGYVQRALHLYPKQGDRKPWINPQNYRQDRNMFRLTPIEDGVLQFGGR